MYISETYSAHRIVFCLNLEHVFPDSIDDAHITYCVLDTVTGYM